LSFLIGKALRISTSRHEKAVRHIDALLSEVESRFADGRTSILGGEEINYTDIAFAAIMGLWLQPDGYGGGKADTVRIERSQAPQAMLDEIESWSERFPRSTNFIEGLYRSERLQPVSPSVG
jgi:glutathione S-transferase